MACGALVVAGALSLAVKCVEGRQYMKCDWFRICLSFDRKRVVGS